VLIRVEETPAVVGHGALSWLRWRFLWVATTMSLSGVWATTSNVCQLERNRQFAAASPNAWHA